MKLRPGRYWPAMLLVAIFAITVLLLLIRLSAGALVGSIAFDRYDGSTFFYWSIYYSSDLYLMVFPVGFMIFVIIAILRRLWKRPEQPNPIFRYSFGVVGVVAAIACAPIFILLMGIYEAPLPTHWASLQLSHKTYHLGTISMLGGYDHSVLYGCDEWGLICRVAHSENRDHLQLSRPFQPEISVNPINGTINLIIDGKIVYSETSD
jgi:hypothetical protein